MKKVIVAAILILSSVFADAMPATTSSNRIFNQGCPPDTMKIHKYYRSFDFYYPDSFRCVPVVRYRTYHQYRSGYPRRWRWYQ